MKKIFTLVALLAGMATAALAEGGFSWKGPGATYDATQNALILENANLTQLDVATSSYAESSYGLTYKIIVKGTCTVSPTSKLNGITFGHSNFTSAPTLKIVGEGENPTLTLNGQDKAGLYMATNGYLDLENINLICNGKLNTAQYGICGYSASKKFQIWMRTNVLLTLDGNTSQWNYLYSISGKTPTVIFPAGATLNKSYDNNFIILNGENYNGKATLATGSGITIGGVEVDYSNGDNFTNTVTSGKVTFQDGVLRFENATITGEIDGATSNVRANIELEGDNYINNNVSFATTTLNGADENTKLTINGSVSLRGLMTINNVHLQNISTASTFGGVISGDYPTVTLNNGSLYAEGSYLGISKSTVSAPNYGYVIDEGTTSTGKKYIYARLVEDYGIKIHKSSSQSYEVNSENATDPLGDGTISYNPDNKRLTLKNANLMAIDLAGDLVELYSEQGTTNMITGNGAKAIIADLSELVITGPGSLNVVTQNNNVALYCATRNTNVEIVNTNLNISSSSYAIQGAGTGWEASVAIDNSNVSLQSGIAGLLDYVNAFTLDKAEFVSPADVMFFNGQLCVNYQPIVANTEVEIKAMAQGIEEVIATTPADKARKVLVDGRVLIIRDGKAFDLTGTEVK